MGGVVVVAPCDASEGGSRFVGGLVNDGDAAFGMFAAEFGDEGEVAGTIDVGLDLGSELWEGKSCGVAGVVVAVGDYVDDDIEKVGSVVAVVEGVGVVWCQWWMGEGSGTCEGACFEGGDGVREGAGGWAALVHAAFNANENHAVRGGDVGGGVGEGFCCPFDVTLWGTAVLGERGA